jgi:hypothetical protein
MVLASCQSNGASKGALKHCYIEIEMLVSRTKKSAKDPLSVMMRAAG